MSFCMANLRMMMMILLCFPFTKGRKGKLMGIRDDASLGPLISHQCGPGSNPRVDAIGGWFLSLLQSFLVFAVFLTPQKPTFLNSNSTWKQCMKNHSVDMPPQIPIYFICLFIYDFTVCVMPNIMTYVTMI